jgi:hypothetical protein
MLYFGMVSSEFSDTEALAVISEFLVQFTKVPTVPPTSIPPTHHHLHHHLHPPLHPPPPFCPLTTILRAGCI